MSRWGYSKQGEAYVRGIQNAYAKGCAAAEDPAITEKDCPYVRYEHRKSWLDGLRETRAKAPPAKGRPEPMW